MRFVLVALSLALAVALSCAPAPTEEPEEPNAPDEPDVPVVPSEAELALQAILDDALTSLPTPGASACIVKHGAVAWCGAAGVARFAGDDEQVSDDVPATPDTPFLLASVSKTFTGAAVMQLVERGELDLDAPIAAPFDVVNPTYPDDAITMRMLLTHTSSIADNWDAIYELYFYGADPSLSLGDAVRSYFTPGEPLYSDASFSTARPGTAWDYANMAVALAGFLVENQRGVDFAVDTRASLLEPLGMTNSSWRLADFDVTTIAMPYVQSGASWTADGDVTYSDYPDGGMRASAHDLARWLACLTRGGELDGARVLEAATVLEMTSSAVPDVDETQGIIVYSSPWIGGTWWGHGGDEAGVATDMYWRESDGLGVILLLNTSRPDGMLAVEEALVEAAQDL